MPPKLQVDESFAFLFMCIEASGCKVDFKLVGDATDLQPAAARMRYTRLKKAVEAGHFKGAVLSQPQQTSASLAQLANPSARRTTNANTGRNRRPKSTVPDSDTVGTSSPSLVFPEYHDEQEEDYEEDEESEIEVPAQKSAPRKRKKAAVAVTGEDDENDDLFFPDTSQASETPKKIKRSASAEVEDAVQEEDEDHDADGEFTPIRAPRGNASKDRAHPSLRHAITKSTPRRTAPGSGRNAIAALTRQAQGQSPQSATYESPAAMDPRFKNFFALNFAQDSQAHEEHDAYHVPVRSHPRAAPTAPSRRKQSANTAAESAYTVGLATGRFEPETDDADYASSAEHASRLGYVGESLHSASQDYSSASEAGRMQPPQSPAKPRSKNNPPARSSHNSVQQYPTFTSPCQNAQCQPPVSSPLAVSYQYNYTTDPSIDPFIQQPEHFFDNRSITMGHDSHSMTTAHLNPHARTSPIATINTHLANSYYSPTHDQVDEEEDREPVPANPMDIFAHFRGPGNGLKPSQYFGVTLPPTPVSGNAPTVARGVPRRDKTKNGQTGHGRDRGAAGGAGDSSANTDLQGPATTAGNGDEPEVSASSQRPASCQGHDNSGTAMSATGNNHSRKIQVEPEEEAGAS